MKRRLAAILAADVVGYSRLMEADEEATAHRLSTYREIIEVLVASHHGRVFGSAGDSVVAEFASPVEAVRCAVSIQRELEALNVNLAENRRMHLRIGVNLGDVIVEGDNLLGDGVNIAARLEALATPGGISLSRSVFDRVKKQLDLDYEYLGEHEVKNIAEPVQVYRVLTEREAAGKGIGETKRATQSWQRGALAAAVVVLIGAAGAVVWLRQWEPTTDPASVERMALPFPDKPSVAVLPFINMSSDPEQAYFVDGITGDLVTDLSKFPGLRVASRSSIAAYQEKPVGVRQASQDLGVQYIVEGSVEKTANRIRVTAQLTEAASGTQLWAQRFDRELVDLFAVRDEIRVAIVGALTGYTGPLNRAEQKRATQQIPDRLTARDFYYRAYAEFSKFDKDANIQARFLLEKSIALDPDDVGAHWLLAWVHWRDYWVYGIEGGEKSLDIALAEARKSVELDQSDYRGHWVLGAILRLRGNSDTAMAEYERALDLNPNDPDMLADWGEFLSYSGQPEKAAAYIERAMALNPSYPDWYISLLSRAYYNSRQYNKSIQMGRLVTKVTIGTLEVLAASYAQIDRIDEAKAEVQKILSARPDYSIEVVIADNRSMEETLMQHLLDGLRKAGLPE